VYINQLEGPLDNITMMIMGLLANFTDNSNGETWGEHAKCTYLE